MPLPATATAGRRIVAVFAITQTIGYGTLYYAFAVLLQPIARDLHTSPTTVTGAFTTAIVTSALMAVPVGRWLDRHGGRAVMTLGALAGAALLVAWSRTDAVWQLYAVFVGLGAAMAMVLYEPATAVIVSWFEPAARPRAILAMIVVAGFASTIFMPLTGLLTDRLGWRATLIILAAVYGTVAVPLHALVIRRPPAARSGRPPPNGGELVRTALRDGRFWCLAGAFLAHGAAMSTMTVHLVSFLTGEGHPAPFGATVAGLLGLLSVTGRLLLTAAQRRIRLTTVVAAVFTVQALAALSLPVVGSTTAGAVVAVIGFGLGFGVASLASPVLLANRYGTAAYASIAGALATPVTLAKATAPLGAAALATRAGYPTTLTAVAAACLLAAAGIVARSKSPAPAHVKAGVNAGRREG